MLENNTAKQNLQERKEVIEEEKCKKISTNGKGTVYIPDTSALVERPYILDTLVKMHPVVIHPSVLRQLDFLKKSENQDTAFKARKASRLIYKYQKEKKVWVDKRFVPIDVLESTVDNKVVGLAIWMKNMGYRPCLITTDTNMKIAGLAVDVDSVEDLTEIETIYIGKQQNKKGGSTMEKCYIIDNHEKLLEDPGILDRLDPDTIVISGKKQMKKLKKVASGSDPEKALIAKEVIEKLIVLEKADRFWIRFLLHRDFSRQAFLFRIIAICLFITGIILHNIHEPFFFLGFLAFVIAGVFESLTLREKYFAPPKKHSRFNHTWESESFTFSKRRKVSFPSYEALMTYPRSSMEYKISARWCGRKKDN